MVIDKKKSQIFKYTELERSESDHSNMDIIYERENADHLEKLFSINAARKGAYSWGNNDCLYGKYVFLTVYHFSCIQD